jgi:hypothetical protein
VLLEGLQYRCSPLRTDWAFDVAKRLRSKWPDAQPLVLYLATGQLYNAEMKEPHWIEAIHSQFMQVFLVLSLRSAFVVEHMRAINTRRQTDHHASSPQPAFFMAFDPAMTVEGRHFLRAHHILAHRELYTAEMYPASTCLKRALLLRGKTRDEIDRAMVGMHLEKHPMLFYAPSFATYVNPYTDDRVKTMLKALQTEDGLSQLAFLAPSNFRDCIPPALGGFWKLSDASKATLPFRVTELTDSALPLPFLNSFGVPLPDQDMQNHQPIQDKEAWKSSSRRTAAFQFRDDAPVVWHWTQEASRGLHLQWVRKEQLKARAAARKADKTGPAHGPAKHLRA